MKYTNRMAAGVVALAAIFTPAQALADSGSSPAPVAGTTPSAIVLQLDRDQSQIPADSTPGYAARFADWISCMNAEGLPIEATSTGVTAGGWTYGTPTTAHERYLDSLAGENARDQIEDSCVVQAFNLNAEKPAAKHKKAKR